MTVKSIVDIDLSDEKFKRFQTMFSKYNDALSKQPGMWDKTNKAMEQTDATVNKIVAAFLAMGQFHRELAEENDKDNKNLTRKSGLWDKISKASNGILKDVEGISKWMLKWGGISLGLGIGGLFGLRAIAEEVSAQRNQALGLDLGIGQSQAFGLHQGRYFDNPAQLLQGAFTARSNLASPAFQAIASLGINPNQSTVGVADSLLLKLQQMAKAMPQQQLGNLLQEYPGLAGFGVDLQGLQRLRSISTSELKGQIKEYGPAASGLRLSDNQGRQFQDFVTRVDTTFGKVLKQVERDLVPLLGPIEKLIGSIGKDITVLLRGKAAAEGIDAMAKAIDRFTGYITSSVFQNDVKDFADGIGTVANVIGFVAHVIAHPLDTIGDALGDYQKALRSWVQRAETDAHGGNPNWRNGMQGGAGTAAPAGGPTAAPQATTRAPVAGGKGVALVNIRLHNATGADVAMSVNSLNGGAA